MSNQKWIFSSYIELNPNRYKKKKLDLYNFKLITKCSKNYIYNRDFFNLLFFFSTFIDDTYFNN